MRVHHGRDIGGACGQLALDHTDRSHIGTRGGVGDIEDLMASEIVTGGGSSTGKKVVRRRIATRRRRQEESEDEESDEEDEEEEEDLLVQSKPLPFMTCSRVTWIVSSGGFIIALLVAAVVKFGLITTYILSP